MDHTRNPQPRSLRNAETYARVAKHQGESYFPEGNGCTSEPSAYKSMKCSHLCTMKANVKTEEKQWDMVSRLGATVPQVHAHKAL